MAACPKCQTRYSGGARICRNCGSAVPPADVPASSEVVEVVPAGVGIRVCAGCGLRVPLRSFAADGRTQCVLCGHVQDQAIIFWRMVLKHARKVIGLDVAEPWMLDAPRRGVERR